MLMVKPNVTLGATIVCLHVLFYFYFFLREFQLMTSALNDKDSFLSSADQDTKWFLV